MKMKIRRWNPGKEEEPIKYIVNTSNPLLYTIIRSYYILNFRPKQTVRGKALEVTHEATHQDHGPIHPFARIPSHHLQEVPVCRFTQRDQHPFPEDARTQFRSSKPSTDCTTSCNGPWFDSGRRAVKAGGIFIPTIHITSHSRVKRAKARRIKVQVQ